MQTSQAATAFTPAPAVPQRLDLPLIGMSYPQVLRSPRHRWWNPVLSWFLAALLGIVAAVVPVVIYMGGVLAVGGVGAVEAIDLNGVDVPMTFVLNLSLSLFIVAALLAVALGHPVAARFLHSVEGRVRWGWLGRCVVALLPLWVVYLAVSWAVDGPRDVTAEAQWLPLLLMVLFMTPLQAAGEEYLFRGFVMVSIGAWFRRPLTGLVLASIVSSALFAAAHGSADPWIVLDLVVMSVLCVYLTWRTGGLEAAVAIHVVNNVVVGIYGLITGTTSEAYIDAAAQSSPLQAAVSGSVMAIATAIIVWMARRHGVSRTVPDSVGARP